MHLLHAAFKCIVLTVWNMKPVMHACVGIKTSFFDTQTTYQMRKKRNFINSTFYFVERWHLFADNPTKIRAKIERVIFKRFFQKKLTFCAEPQNLIKNAHLL